MFLVDAKTALDVASCAAPYTGELIGIHGSSLYGFSTVFGQIRRILPLIIFFLYQTVCQELRISGDRMKRRF